jgi:hypothetical protein
MHCFVSSLDAWSLQSFASQLCLKLLQLGCYGRNGQWLHSTKAREAFHHGMKKMKEGGSSQHLEGSLSLHLDDSLSQHLDDYLSQHPDDSLSQHLEDSLSLQLPPEMVQGPPA